MVSSRPVPQDDRRLQAEGQRGPADNNNCIYGYKKDPEQKNHWLVDEEAAQVVRRIYQMACEGHGAYEIAVC